jgi:hypothetical protein
MPTLIIAPDIKAETWLGSLDAAATPPTAEIGRLAPDGPPSVPLAMLRRPADSTLPAPRSQPVRPSSGAWYLTCSEFASR